MKDPLGKLPPILKEGDIYHVPYERYLVEFVDSLIKLANKNESKSHVRREKDWETIAYMFKGFCVLYPQTAKSFLEHMKEVHKASAHGIAREGEGMIQHKLEVPRPFYEMFDAIFPDQEWDKKFCERFAQRMPMFAGGEKL